MKKLLTLVIISLATTLTVWGQIVITGTVISKDSNEAIPGVDVIEKDTNNRTMTNVDGTFSIEVDNLNSTLIFSFVGMVTKEYPLDGQKQIVVKTKWDCNKDFFDSQQIGVLFNTGVINTPIGGQIELAGYFGRTMPGISVKWCHSERCCKVVNIFVIRFLKFLFSMILPSGQFDAKS